MSIKIDGKKVIAKVFGTTKLFTTTFDAILWLQNVSGKPVTLAKVLIRD